MACPVLAGAPRIACHRNSCVRVELARSIGAIRRLRVGILYIPLPPTARKGTLSTTLADSAPCWGRYPAPAQESARLYASSSKTAGAAVVKTGEIAVILERG